MGMEAVSVVELQRYLAGVLRYFASAVVGVSLVWAFDDKHDIINEAFSHAWPAGTAPPSWVLIGLLGVVGLLTYFVHRVAFHWIATRAILMILRFLSRGRQVPSDLDLDFARWRRRGGKDNTEARAVQNALDEINAATHFLYCSAWSSLIIAGFLKAAEPGSLNLSPGFGGVVAALFVLGCMADFRAATFDVEAYRRFKSHDA